MLRFIRGCMLLALLTWATRTASVSGADRALIVEGFMPEQFNYPGLTNVGSAVWNDPFLWAELGFFGPDSSKADYGPIPSDRIYYLYADGKDWNNLYRQADRYKPYNRLGLARLSDTSATIQTCSLYLWALAHGGVVGRETIPVMADTDRLFVYFSGHGDAIGSRAYLHVAPIDTINPGGGWICVGDSLWDTTFARMLNDVPCGHRILLMQQCHSGGFIDPVCEGHPNTTIMCGTEISGLSYMADDKVRGIPKLTWPENESLTQYPAKQYHGEFSLHVMNALRGRSLHPFYGLHFNPDITGDGVSWKEAFRYAAAVVSTRDQPVCSMPGYERWVQHAYVPLGSKNKCVKGGGALTALTDNTDTIRVFAFKGNNRFEFYRYNDVTNTWSTTESIPAIGRSGKKKAVKKGSTLAAANGLVFATKGNATLEFWRYYVTAGSWSQMPDVPAGVKTIRDGAGAVAVWLGDTAYVYFLKGSNTQEFYRFNVATFTWETMASAPLGSSGKTFRAGSCLAYDPDLNQIYALKGSANELFRFDVVNNTWTTATPLPMVGNSKKKKKAGSGAGIVCDNGFLYAMKGNGTREFWFYWIDRDTWRQYEDMPVGAGKKVKDGGALTLARGTIWALKGNNTLEFFSFAPNPTGLLSYGQQEPSPAGSNELLLSLGEGQLSPRWNAGDKVTFCKPDSTTGHLQVFTVNYDGSDRQQLTFFSDGDCDHPVWRPGDSLLGFEYCDDANSGYVQIGIVPASGGTTVIITSDSSDHENPEWLNDSALVCDRDDDSTGYRQLFSISVPGGSEERLTSSPFDHTRPLPYSSSVIVFQGEDQDGFSQILRYARTGTGTTESLLTNSAADHENPSLARDAGFVTYQVFVSCAAAGSTYQIARVPVWGGNEQQLTWGSLDMENPSVSPDGSAMHAVRRGDPGDAICCVDPNGYGSYAITDEQAERNHPNSVVDVTGRPTAAYEREDGVYRTGNGSAGGGQSNGRTQLAVDGLAPNPANGPVKLLWHIRKETRVSLKVYNAAGRLVNRLIDQTVRPGSYATVWNGTDSRGRRLAGGIYFCSLETNDAKLNQKVVLTE